MSLLLFWSILNWIFISTLITISLLFLAQTLVCRKISLKSRMRFVRIRDTTKMKDMEISSQRKEIVPRFDVSGMGNPLVDILVYVDDNFLISNHLNKGIMHLIEEDGKRKLIKLIKGKKIEMEAGGSCPNTIASLGILGLRAALTGKIGDDDFGSVFEEKIINKNVTSFLKKEYGPTGTSIILITPDKERTMNTHLGLCREYKKEDLPYEMIENSTFFYFTGYMWDTENQKVAVKDALLKAKNSGVKVIFDVADPFAVNRYRKDFLEIIKNDVDIVLSNAQESEILTGTKIEDGIRKLGELARIAVVKNGAADTLIYSNGKLTAVPSFKTDVKDTTGAGDNFSAGFIYGLIKGYPLELCGRIAGFIASKTIAEVGAQAPENIKYLVKRMFEKQM